MTGLNRRLFVAAGALTALEAPRTLAQALADKTVTFVFNFATGGSGDGSARLIAEKVRQALKANVIVDNKTGAAGRIGVNAVKAARADGTTLLYTPFAPMSLYPHSYKDLGYDPVADFKPVALAATFEFALAVNAETPVKTVADLVAWLKTSPDKATYGSPGAGTLPHFMGVSFARMAGLPLAHATYRGSAAAITDLIGGHVPFVFSTTPDFVPHVRSGKIRVLATSDAARSQFLPDIPTFKEQGYDIEGVGWYAFYASAGTPDATVAELSKAVADAVAMPDVKEKLLSMGLVPAGSAPAVLAARQKADSERWAPVIKASGFTPEQ